MSQGANVHRLPAERARPRARRAGDSGRAAIRVLVADGYAAARAGAGAAVEPFGFRVVAEAADAAEALAAAREARPQLCVVAADLPGGGLSATRALAQALPQTKIVVLGGVSTDVDLALALEAGASGYLPRAAAPDRLPSVLNAALDGYVSMPLALLARMVQRGDRGGKPVLALPGRPAVALTRREQQVLEALLDGASTAAIAVRLAVSQVTVRRYVSRVLHKAGVRDRASLRAMWTSADAD